MADRSGRRPDGLHAYENPNEELTRSAEDTIVNPIPEHSNLREATNGDPMLNKKRKQ
jgi:hypothetical protein